MLTNAQIEELHALYERLTGQSVVLTIGRRCAWQLWGETVAAWIRHSGHKLGIREALELVVKRRRAQWKDKPHTCASVLKFTNLVEQPDKCEEDLAAATAARRATRAQGDPARAAVLRGTGRAEAAGDGETRVSTPDAARMLATIQQMKEAAK
jgi:hypothetical protein